MLSRHRQQGFSLIELMIGLVAGLVCVILGTILEVLIGDYTWQIAASVFGNVEGMADIIDFLSGGNIYVDFFVNLVFYSIFGLVGGILGTLIFKGNQENPATTV